MEYRERSSPRSAVAGRIYTSTDYPPSCDILPHNENSYAHNWPLKIFFYCERPPVAGGETPLVDVRRVYQRISPATKAKFERLGVLYVRNFHEALGVSWKDTFQTADKDAVEQYCRASGYEFEWTAFGLRTRRLAAAICSHPVTGEKVWFNHAAFFHVSSLPADIRTALMSQFAEEDLPNHTYYGDGSSIEPRVVEELRAAYSSETVRYSWTRGDLLMVDNMLTAHARSAYSGERRILVGMSEPFHATQLQRPNEP
jgi:alpha-ketoglutarate-dependent taurine dioxygenase